MEDTKVKEESILKNIDFKAIIKEQWLYIMIIIAAFVVGMFIGIVRGNVVCQEMFMEAVKNLSCVGIHGPDLIDYGVNLTIS